MPQTINRFFINSYFDISKNVNVNVDNFNFDYILNLDLSLYPPFIGMQTFFTTYNYTINSDSTIGIINLTLNKDLVKNLLTYDFNKYTKNGIITFEPGNIDVFTNPNFGILKAEPCKFGYRILEIIATKIFGNCEDYVLIDNGIDFYKSDGVCLINQVIDDIGNLFNDDTVLNNIMTIYQNDSHYINTPGTHNFYFYNSIWEFPMFYSDAVSFIDGNNTNNFNGPNMGGSEIDNGLYNIPILLKFWGIGGNSPLNVIAIGNNLSVTITWNPPESLKNITAYKIKWTDDNSQIFPINQIIVNNGGTNSVTINNLLGGILYSFTVTAISGSILSIESQPSNSIILISQAAIINNLSAISGYVKAYLTWTPPYNNGSNITAYKFFYNITNSSVNLNSFNFITTWLDASDETSLELNLLNEVYYVINWIDKKNNLDFNCLSINVIYNSVNKFVNFSNTDGYLSFSNLIINNVTRYAFFFVASFATLSQYILIKQQDDISIYLTIGILSGISNNDGKLYWFNNNNNSYANSNTTLNIDTIYLFTVYYDGINFNFKINGELDSSTTGDFSIYNDTNVTLSKLGNSSVFPTNNNWNLYEFIYCNTNVSIDNIELIESYLNFKHNLQLDKYEIVDISSNNTYFYDGLIDLNDFIFLNLLENNKYVIDTNNNLASSINGLYNSSSYDIELAAINSIGTSNLSNTISLITGNKLNYPSNLYGISGIAKVFISWTPPLTVSPNVVTDYKIYYTGADITLPVSTVYSYSGYINFDDLSFLTLFDTHSFIVDTSGNYATTILNLITESSYTIQVSAFNNTLETLKSNSIILTIAGQPSAPLDLTFTIVGDAITLQWKAPLNNGGSNISAYLININSYIEFIERVNINDLQFINPYYSYSISGLESGILYNVYIRAINMSNIIGLDITSSFVIAIPLPPINLTILNTTEKSISFYWNDNILPDNYNNSYSSYKITLNPSDASGNILIDKGNTFHFNNLTKNTNYTISVSTVDNNNFISVPATINAFTGNKYAHNFYLLNQPFNQYAFIFTPGGLDNNLTTDYYLTIFDNNNRILFNLSFGISYSGNAIYDNINNIWQILIPQSLNLISNYNYTFNILVYPFTSTTNADSNREISISIKVPTNQFYIFKTTSLKNNLLLNFFPPYLSASNNSYNLSILDNNSSIIINNVNFTDPSYNILNLVPNSYYTGSLISNSDTAGNNLSNFSFYNYQITDLSASFIVPQTQNPNDLGNWNFTWTKPNNYINDSFITQSFEIISDLSTNNIIFYQDEYQDTSLTLSAYDLINKYGYNSDVHYFQISGYWLSDSRTLITSANYSNFLLQIIPLAPTNLIISDSDYDYLTISWTPSIYPSVKPQSYLYTNYIITVTSSDSSFIEINKIISFGVNSYTIQNLNFNNYTISLAVKDNSNNISSSIIINSYNGKKYASNIVLLNQPNNQYLFNFRPGSLDISTTTDYCLTVFDFNNSNLGTYIFGPTSGGFYNIWSYLLPSNLVLTNSSYTFNLLVYPTGQNNNVDLNRETNITIQIPLNNYYIIYIFNGVNFDSNMGMVFWFPSFINTNELTINNYSITMDSSSGTITSTTNNSIVTLTNNTLYNSQLIVNMSDNITNYITNFTFFNYNVTDISATFIQPLNLINDLGSWNFSWINPNLYGNDIINNQIIHIENNELKYIYNQSSISNSLILSAYDLYNLYNYNLGSNLFIVETTWISDSGINIFNTNSINFTFPSISPVVIATNITTTSITITWNFYDPINISEYQMLINATGHYTTPPTSSYTFTSLTANTPYLIKIWALDSNNDIISDIINLNITTENTTSTVPNPPTNVYGESKDSSVKVYWTPPTSGISVDNYQVSYSTDGINYNLFETTATSSPQTITGLINGTSYTFKVIAINNTFGSSNPSISSSNVTPNPTLAPNAPTNVGCNVGNGQIEVYWTPASTGGTTAYYQISYSYNDVNYTLFETTTPSSPQTITGLLNGRLYRFIVTAHNIIGYSNSAPSNEFAPIYPPNAPTNVLAFVINGTSIYISWDSYSEGEAVDYYKVSYSTDGTNYTIVDDTISYNSNNYTLNGLTSGTTYSIIVIAYNGGGYNMSDPSGQITPQDPPNKPSIYNSEVYTVDGSPAVKLFWNGNADSYSVSISTDLNSMSPWYNLGTFTSGQIITGLDWNTVYYFKVTGINNGGQTDSDSYEIGTGS